MRAELEAARPGRPRRRRARRGDAAPGLVGGRRDVGAGVPLVRPRRGAARDRPRPPPEGPPRARLELPRRPRPVDGAPERDHRQRVDRGVGRRSRSSTRVGCSVRSRRRSSRSCRRSTATGCSTSSSRAATREAPAAGAASRFSTRSAPLRRDGGGRRRAARVRHGVLPRRAALVELATDGLDVVAVGVQEERRVVATAVLGAVLLADAGAPLSRAPASMPARWKASTCSRESATNAMCTGPLVVGSSSVHDEVRELRSALAFPDGQECRAARGRPCRTRRSLRRPARGCGHGR